MSKDYEEELRIMQKGLDSINKAIKHSKNHLVYKRIIMNRSIQEVRIEEFKRGYKFRNMELNSQISLKKENVVYDENPTIQKKLIRKVLR